jgi:ATP-dependent DNA helicase RecG
MLRYNIKEAKRMILNDIAPGSYTETTKYEFKSRLDANQPIKWVKTIAGFANVAGGTMFIGVENKTTKLCGFEQSELDRIVMTVNGKIEKYLQPIPEHAFKYLTYTEEGKLRFIIAVEVPKSKIAPIFLKDDEGNYIIYKRNEGSTDQAKPEEVVSIVLNSSVATYDVLSTAVPFKLEDFKLLASAYHEGTKGKTMTEKTLAGVSFFDDAGNLKRGSLLFKDGCHEANTLVHCRAWNGLSKGASLILDNKEQTGDIMSQIEFMEAFVRRNTKTGLQKTDVSHNDADSYPERAVFEAIVNAVAHRNYLIPGTQIDLDIFADRMVITSPGGMVTGAVFNDKRDIGSIPSKRRNMLICDVLDLCGYMEKSGTGFDRITELYGAYPSKYAPSVSADRDTFSITLKDVTYFEEDASKPTPNGIKSVALSSGKRTYDKTILEFCSEEPRSAKEIAEHIGLVISKHFRVAILNPLIEAGYLVPTTETLRAPNLKYKTSDKPVLG